MVWFQGQGRLLFTTVTAQLKSKAVTVKTGTPPTLRNARNKQALNTEQSRKVIEKELGGIDRKIEGLLDRIVDAGSPSVIAAYERRIGEFESSKLLLKEKWPVRDSQKLTSTKLFETPWRFSQVIEIYEIMVA